MEDGRNAGGISTQYMTSEPMLNRGLELLTMLNEDLHHIGAEGLHQLQRTWELNHRVWTSEAVLRHTPAGNALARLLLPRGFSEAGRCGVARFHRVPVRCEDR